MDKQNLLRIMALPYTQQAPIANLLIAGVLPQESGGRAAKSSFFG